mgnify:CR=1 FL=1
MITIKNIFLHEQPDGGRIIIKRVSETEQHHFVSDNFIAFKFNSSGNECEETSFDCMESAAAYISANAEY